MRGNKWSNVPGNLTIEVAKYQDGWFDLDSNAIAAEIGAFIEREFPGSLVLATSAEDPDSFQVEINFLSSGYYEPAQTSGPPERCYPEEGEDERVLDTIKISPPMEHGYNTAAGRLMEGNEADSVFQFYLDKIAATELDTSGWDDRY